MMGLLDCPPTSPFVYPTGKQFFGFQRFLPYLVFQHLQNVGELINKCCTFYYNIKIKFRKKVSYM